MGREKCVRSACRPWAGRVFVFTRQRADRPWHQYEQAQKRPSVVCASTISFSSATSRLIHEMQQARGNEARNRRSRADPHGNMEKPRQNTNTCWMSRSSMMEASWVLPSSIALFVVAVIIETGHKIGLQHKKENLLFCPFCLYPRCHLVVRVCVVKPVLDVVNPPRSPSSL